jgi:hypothetical protein
LAAFEQLLIELRLQGAQATKAQLREIKEEVRQVGDAFSSLATLGGMAALVSQMGEILSTFADISGMRIANTFNGIARALEAVTGSAGKASRLMEQFKEMGQKTIFDTSEVAGMGARMLGAGVSEAGVVRELGALLDLASHGMGVPREDFPEFMRNLLQIRGRGTGRADMADINQLKDRVPQIGRFMQAGIGGNISIDEAMRKAQSMTGRQLYDTLIKGAEAMAKGAAAARVVADPFERMKNLFENLTASMAPTGRIFLFMSGLFLSLNETLGGIWSKFNQVTGGLAGLAGIIGVGLWLATRTTTVALLNFAKSIIATGLAAKGATGGATGGAAAGATAGAAGMAGVIAAIARIIPIVAIAAIVGDTIDQIVNPRDMQTDTFNKAKELFGDRKWLVDNNGNPVSPRNPMVDEQKKTNELLKELKFQTWGGGARSARAISDFEAQYAMAKMMAI